MTSPSLHILLSNDDGILAPGLLVMHDTLVAAGHRVSVVAPRGERSASGHAISVWREFPVTRVERDGRPFGVALDSTPADCVKFALAHLLAEDRPQLVVGGINPGPNIGDAVFYSGTVAVAAEAAMYGVPAIAVSLAGRWEDEKNFEPAAKFVVKLAAELPRLGMEPRTFLNVNVPNGPESIIQGVVVTRQGSCAFLDHFKPITTRGEAEIWANQGDAMELSPEEPDLDDRVLEEGYISVTPMRLDITWEAARGRLEQTLRTIDLRTRHAAVRHAQPVEHVEEMSPFPSGPVN